MGRIPVEGEGWEKELYVDSFHFLRTNLEAAREGRRHQVVAMTGAVPGVGKSSVAARLSEALALGGSHVVAVDCDLRKPKLHDYFGVSGEFGVADALAAGGGTWAFCTRRPRASSRTPRTACAFSPPGRSSP